MYLIYITFPDKSSAVTLADKLVKAKLIACANIYEGVTSMYEWEGNIQQNAECTMICKVSDMVVNEAINAIATEHDNECPCVIAVKVEKGHDNQGSQKISPIS